MVARAWPSALGSGASSSAARASRALAFTAGAAGREWRVTPARQTAAAAATASGKIISKNPAK